MPEESFRVIKREQKLKTKERVQRNGFDVVISNNITAENYKATENDINTYGDMGEIWMAIKVKQSEI